MSPRHPKSCTCHTESSSCPKSNSTTVSENAFLKPFQRPANIAPARKMISKHTSFLPTLANVLATCRKLHACHADEKVPDVLHLSHKKTFQTSKCPESAMLATRNGHSSKNEHGMLVKRALRKRGLPATISCETSFENGR